MGPVANATRVMDKASVSIHKSTRKKIAARRLAPAVCTCRQSTDC